MIGRDNIDKNIAMSSALTPFITSKTNDPTKAMLVEIENGLGLITEQYLNQHADNLATTKIEQISADYMQTQTYAIKKFFSRNIEDKYNIKEIAFKELVKKYFEAQVNYTQSVNLEQDFLMVGQYIKQQFGVAETIRLLENIHDSAFDLSKFITTNIQKQILRKIEEQEKQQKRIEEQKAKEERGEVNNLYIEVKNIPVPNVNDDFPLLENIQNIIKRITNFYVYLENKKAFFNTDKLKAESSYKMLQESLMWINGQKLTCLTGMQRIQNKTGSELPAARINSKAVATPYQGARKLILNMIGPSVDEELEQLNHLIARDSVPNIVDLLKSKKFYTQLLESFNSNTRAGLNTVLPNAPKKDLVALADEFLNVSVYLTQSLLHEKDIIEISRYMYKNYGIEKSKQLLIDIEKPDFDVVQFLKQCKGSQLPQRMLDTIRNIHKFYLYADIKKNDSFFDNDDIQAQKLFESEMWLSLQRHCCIQGLTLIDSKLAYANTQICLNDIDKPLDAISVTDDNPSPFKISKIVEAGSSSSSFPINRARSSALQPTAFDPNKFQRDVDEEAALAQMIQLSSKPQPVQNDDAELHEAIRRSLEPSIQSLPQTARAHEAKRDTESMGNKFVAAAASGNIEEVKRLKETYQIPVDILNNDGLTALMAACQEGHLPMVKALVETHNANVAVLCSKHGATKAIGFAAKSNKPAAVAIVAYLISKGAQPLEVQYYPDLSQNPGKINTIIDFAAAGQLASLKIIIPQYKLPANIQIQAYMGALLAAAKQRHADVIEYLVGISYPNVNAVSAASIPMSEHSSDKNQKKVADYHYAHHAEPSPVSNKNTEVKYFNIVDDAIKIIEGLQKLADKMKGVINKGKDPDLNIAKYSREAHLFSKNRFYAAARLIEKSVSNKFGLLTIDCRTMPEQIQVMANYDPIALLHQYHMPFMSNKLPAPISQVPFESFYDLTKEFLKTNFENWQTNESDKSQLVKIFKTFDDYMLFLGKFASLVDILKEVYDLNLEMSVVNKNGTHQLIIDKNQFEKAKITIGYVSPAAVYGNARSMAGLVAASSSIMSSPSSELGFSGGDLELEFGRNRRRDELFSAFSNNEEESPKPKNQWYW